MIDKKDPDSSERLALSPEVLSSLSRVLMEE